MCLRAVIVGLRIWVSASFWSLLADTTCAFGVILCALTMLRRVMSDEGFEMGWRIGSHLTEMGGKVSVRGSLSWSRTIV